MYYISGVHFYIQRATAATASAVALCVMLLLLLAADTAVRHRTIYF